MKTNPRFEMKVGLFAFFGILVIAFLMLNFSKGLTLFTPTYEVRVLMPTISGLKPKSSVMISGVPIGSVVSTKLSPSGTNVIIRVKIFSKFKVHSDAEFHIDALGFLGDQYLAITPTKNEGPLLKDGDTVTGVAPFNLQEAVRSTSGLLEQARHTMQTLDQAILNINNTILSPQTLTNFGNTISNLESVTASVRRTTETVENVINSNSAPLTMTLNNLRATSEKLSAMADELQGTISTNRSDFTAAIKDLRATAHNMDALSTDLQAGKGVAGSLLKDEELRAQTATMIANLNVLSANLSQFSSNLNQKGLWSMLWKPKHAGKNVPSR